MPSELLAMFEDDLPQPPLPAPAAPDAPAAPALAEARTPQGAQAAAPTDLGQQVQIVASEARSQSLSVEEVSCQLHQMARLVVQNREDVQGAWAASQRLEKTARELDELVKYFD